MAILDGASPQDWGSTSKEVNLDEIKKAKDRLQAHISPTPISKSLFNSDRFSLKVFFKLENFNITGSFKIRGAGNALLSRSLGNSSKEVIAASAGNHAQGVAYMSRILGRSSRIFMPERTPLVKVAATKSHGAEVELIGKIYDESYQAAIEYQKKHGGVLIHAFEDADVINGQGTVGLEILEQISNLGVVIVPVGGGGLISGIACAIKSQNPNIKIVGVQTKSFPSMKESLQEGKIKASPSGMTIADGIAVKRPSTRTMALVQHYVDELFLVSDDEIAAAIMTLMEKDHILAEGAGAASVAALQIFSDQIKTLANGKDVCCIVSGGNIDVPLVSRIATRGLIATGRMMRLSVKMQDRPGQLAELLRSLGETGANLLDVRHNRHFGAMYYSDVSVELDLETADFQHQTRIQNTLNQLKLEWLRLN